MNEEEVARLQDSEVRIALKGLLRNLLEVRGQRQASLKLGMTPVRHARRVGEIWGLDIAINAVKRRLQ